MIQRQYQTAKWYSYFHWSMVRPKKRRKSADKELKESKPAVYRVIWILLSKYIMLRHCHKLISCHMQANELSRFHK